MIRPSSFQNPKRIRIGSNVFIGKGCIIACFGDAYIVIGDKVHITGSIEIYAKRKVQIHDNCLIASNCLIVDHHHGMNPDLGPYSSQGSCNIEVVVVSEGCWIGKNVAIMPGVTIGARSIVGANSVVTKDIPPYTMSVGVPAKVIKTWDFKESTWISVSSPCLNS